MVFMDNKISRKVFQEMLLFVAYIHMSVHTVTITQNKISKFITFENFKLFVFSIV